MPSPTRATIFIALCCSGMCPVQPVQPFSLLCAVLACAQPNPCNYFHCSVYMTLLQTEMNVCWCTSKPCAAFHSFVYVSAEMSVCYNVPASSVPLFTVLCICFSRDERLLMLRQAMCLMDEDSQEGLTAALACVQTTECSQFSVDAINTCMSEPWEGTEAEAKEEKIDNKCEKLCRSGVSSSLWPCRCSQYPKKRSSSVPSFKHSAPMKTPNKRYRLGLYDCIASYCGSAVGALRKSCIINYCHRSTVKF